MAFWKQLHLQKQLLVRSSNQEWSSMAEAKTWKQGGQKGLCSRSRSSLDRIKGQEVGEFQGEQRVGQEMEPQLKCLGDGWTENYFDLVWASTKSVLYVHSTDSDLLSDFYKCYTLGMYYCPHCAQVQELPGVKFPFLGGDQSMCPNNPLELPSLLWVTQEWPKLGEATSGRTFVPGKTSSRSIFLGFLSPCGACWRPTLDSITSFLTFLVELLTGGARGEFPAERTSVSSLVI